MKHLIKFLFLSFSLMVLVSCGNEKAKDDNNKQEDITETENDIMSLEKNGIKIVELKDSPEFPDAGLNLNQPEDLTRLGAGKNKFVFNVENYMLGEMTHSSVAEHAANSHQGQHIHWILNNEPYTAHYEPVIEKELQQGKHLLLAFLSRSYHESIKNKSAFVLKQLNVGNESTQADFNLNDPYLFYSRPKGEYTASEMENLLLDFYLVNTDLSRDGNKVKVWIDGTEFILTQWKPYLVQGLQPGDHIFRIQLLDSNNNTVPGPFNDSGDRKITLKQQ